MLGYGRVSVAGQQQRSINIYRFVRQCRLTKIVDALLASVDELADIQERIITRSYAKFQR